MVCGKKNPTLLELSLYSSRISFNYFDGDIFLVKPLLYRIKYNKNIDYIIFWYLQFILFLSFKLYHRWNHCHTDHISTWFYISFIIHLFWTPKQWYQCNLSRSSHKWQRAIIDCLVCCITTVIRLRCYIVPINLFYIINCFSNTISTCFVAITAKKVSLIYIIEQNLFLRFK